MLTAYTVLRARLAAFLRVKSLGVGVLQHPVHFPT